MKKIIRKAFSWALAGAVTLGTFASMPILSANAYTGGHSQSDAVAWAQSKEGNYLDYDGHYGAQCVDFIYYYYQYLGVGVVGGNGCDYCWNELPNGWSRTTNYSGYTPQPGDICVWGPYAPYCGEYGHVGIVVGGDANRINTLEQNVDGSPVRSMSRNTSDITCFIRPDFASAVPQGHVMSQSEGAGQTIPDGDYYIVSKIAQDYFIDIPGNDFNTQDGKNVQMWCWTSGMSPEEGYDCFHFQYLNNGFYKIYQINTNKCLDVYGASLDRGANINMYTDNGSNAQQWSIEKKDHGYSLRARCNGYCMDVWGAGHANGTNVSCWEWYGSDAQFFGLIPRKNDERPVSDGVYTIKTKVNGTSDLDVAGSFGNIAVGSNVQIWNSDDYEEHFLIQYLGNGWYKICEATNGLAVGLEKTDANILDPTNNIIVKKYTGAKDQIWKIRKNSDGSFSFINKATGCYMDLKGSKTNNGNNVLQYFWGGTDNQKWLLTSAGWTVTYNLNGGTGSIPSQTKQYGENLKLSTTVPKRAGYQFSGWSTTSNAASADYKPGDSYTTNLPLTLYAVWKQLPLSNTTTIESTTIYSGSPLKINASATGGAVPYKYSVKFKKSTSQYWTIVQNDSDTKAVSFIPEGTGTYDVSVTVKDSKNTTATKTFTVTVKAKTLTAKATVAKTLKLGKSLSVTVAGSGGTGKYTYGVFYKKTSSTKWITAQDINGKKNVVTIKPTAAVKYDICVKVKDSSGKIAKQYYTVTVTKALTNNSKLSATSIKKGGYVIVTAKASGGAGHYTYAVLYKKASSQTWITAQSYGTNTSVKIKPSSAVKYDISVKVKDSKGTIAKKLFTLTVNK